MTSTLPYRGDGTDRPRDFALPPGRMPLLYAGRPLKRWRYVGVYGRRFMLCAGVVHVAGIPQAFWAVWDRAAGVLRERTIVMHTSPVRTTADTVHVIDRGVSVDLRLEPAGEAVEVVSQDGRAYIWTRKWPVVATGTVTADGTTERLRAGGLVDESAGYHARHTAWEWAAGVGVASDGREVAWNIVAGLHDAPTGSERTVWVDGLPHELGAATFSPTLDRVAFDGGELRFTEEAIRRRRDRLLVISSDYSQPFGTCDGSLLAGVDIGEGYGVMERHRATW